MSVIYSELRQPLELDFSNPLSPNKIAIFPSVGQEGYATNFADGVNKSNAIYDAVTNVEPPHFAQIDTEVVGNVPNVSGPIENGLFALKLSPRYNITRHVTFKCSDYQNNHRFYVELHDDGIQYRFGNKAQTSTQAFSSSTDNTNILTISVRWIKNGSVYDYECIVYDTDFTVLNTFTTTSNTAPFTSLSSKNSFYKVGKLYGLYLSEGVYTAQDAVNVSTDLYSVLQKDSVPVEPVETVISSAVQYVTSDKSTLSTHNLLAAKSVIQGIVCEKSSIESQSQLLAKATVQEVQATSSSIESDSIFNAKHTQQPIITTVSSILTTVLLNVRTVIQKQQSTQSTVLVGGEYIAVSANQLQHAFKSTLEQVAKLSTRSSEQVLLARTNEMISALQLIANKAMQIQESGASSFLEVITLDSKTAYQEQLAYIESTKAFTLAFPDIDLENVVVFSLTETFQCESKTEKFTVH